MSDLPENGTDIFTGQIDNQNVPKLRVKNGVLVGIGPNGGAGEYINQIAFRKSNSTYYKWNGVSWVTVSDVQNLTEATKLFRQRDEFKEATANDSITTPALEKEKLKLSAYKTAINPVGFTSLRYPDNIATSDNSDFVLFDFFDYQPPFKDNQIFGSELPDSLKASDANVNWASINKNKDKRNFVNETLPQYLRSGQSADLYKRDTSGRYPQIMLYMPDDISDTLKADWEGKAFGSTTAGILSAAAAEGNIEKLKGAMNVSNKTIQKASVELAAGLVTNLAKGITGDTINTGDIFGGISGAIRNPNVEVLFQKMNLRTFDLSFKLVPYNAKEAKTIKKVVNVFKKSMLPTYQLGDYAVLGTKGKDNRAVEASFIRVPKVCKVTYMRGSEQHPDLPTYKMCAITDVAINYTPDGNYAVYYDGTPVAYELKVSFMETKLLFSDEIDTGPDMNTAPAGQEYGAMRSDVRLKENITKVGNSPSGINIYEWNYIGNTQRYRGVMAQEILERHPEAVALQPDGYLSVYYGKIDVNMERVK